MFRAACMKGQDRMIDWLLRSFRVGDDALRGGMTLATAAGQVAALELLEPLAAPDQHILAEALRLAASDTGGCLPRAYPWHLDLAPAPQCFTSDTS
jgi:hypothetical protein